VIQVKHLTRKYGSFTAVNAINFSIPKGQVVGLLGHNGAGKTTTLKMLTGYLEPTSGSVTIDGIDVAENPIEAQKKIGYLSEQSPLYPDMTVWQYLLYVAEMRGLDGAAALQAVSDAIEATDLGDKAADLIATLSRGYKQRVGVAQAILHKPEFLFLDEPTNGLDPTQILSMRKLILSLAQRSTVVLSTHIMQEVEAMCDRVIIVMGGRLVLDSSLKDLQVENAISLSVDADTGAVETALKTMSGFAGLETLGQKDQRHEYRVRFDGSLHDVAPLVARQAVEKGWKLYQLHSETKNLESIFNEVNRAAGGVGHA
jgi:ABC-2 type transport system ATP-binding protein